MEALYLVTGATGNLGSNVTSQLLDAGKKVRALVLPNDPGLHHMPSGVETAYGDIMCTNDLEKFFEAPEGTELYCIHCAGIVTTQWEFSQKIYDINVEGTRNVVNQCVKAHVKRFVYISSVHAIPVLPKGQTMTEVTSFNPDSIVGFYGKTKAAASQIVMDAVHNSGLDASIIFPSGLCGPNDYAGGHITQLLLDSCNGKLPAGIEGGFDFVDVRDVAGGIVACCERGRNGEGYILGNRYFTIREVLHDISQASGIHEIRHMLPFYVARLFVPAFALYYKIKKQKPLFTKYSLYTLSCNAKYSSEKAKRELGYRTRPFIQTISDALAWLRKEKRILA